MKARSKPLVLLVDDEEIFIEIASTKLAGEGLETVKAIGFYDAIAKAESLLPDLILSDIFMPPGPSGWDLALELHRNPKTREIKLVFFTSLRDPFVELAHDKKRTLAELGNVTFLSKTDDIEVLAERVLDILQTPSHT